MKGLKNALNEWTKNNNLQAILSNKIYLPTNQIAKSSLRLKSRK